MSLLDTLQSLEAMDVPEEIEWEVIIVDNNSPDDTEKRVKEFIDGKRPQFKYIFEPERGKAHALNHGIREAKGEILAFTDDDAIVDKNWLRSIVETFRDYDPICVGGKICALWLGPRPDWLTDRLLHVLAVQDLGERIFDVDIDGKQYMFYGVNVAYKSRFFKENGEFKTNLCARGGCGNEDQEMFDRVRRAKGRAVYNPGVLVSHKVFPERLSKHYFRKWHYLNAKDLANLDSESKAMIVNIPLYMIRNFLLQIAHLLKAALKNDRECFFLYECKTILYLSYFQARLYRHFEQKFS